jgi:hypothetical protein
MWVAIGVIAVVGLIIVLLLRPSRPASADGPLPPDVEAEVLLGEDPDRIRSPDDAEGDDRR